jgi:hypothetical protein
VDLGQTPQAGLAYSIQTPDGSVVAGTLDTKGRASAKSSTPGTFVVTFPDLDGADWDGDGALALPETERSLASKYKVEQGDRLPTIARDKGFFRWQTIWDFADNADLKALRGTAHILLPDDEVAIPSKLARKAEVPGGTAVYVVQSSAEVLRVCFLGVNSSAEDPVTFEATPDTGDAIFGTLPDDGKLEIDLPPDTTKVHVDLFRKSPSKANDDESNSDDDADSSDDAASDDAASDAASSDDEPFACYDFEVGGLDPAKEMSGIQARLLNLGFYQGDLSGELDDDTRDAITQFRWAKLRDRKDDMDDDFLTALNAAHGS